MRIGALRAELYIPLAGSLKEKRMVIRSVKDRLRARFNVSVAEIGYQDKWQRTSLGVVMVGADGAYVARALEEVVEFLRRESRAELTFHEHELL